MVGLGVVDVLVIAAEGWIIDIVKEVFHVVGGQTEGAGCFAGRLCAAEASHRVLGQLDGLENFGVLWRPDLGRRLRGLGDDQCGGGRKHRCGGAQQCTIEDATGRFHAMILIIVGAAPSPAPSLGGSGVVQLRFG